MLQGYNYISSRNSSKETINDEVLVGLDQTYLNIPGFAAGFKVPNVHKDV